MYEKHVFSVLIVQDLVDETALMLESTVVKVCSVAAGLKRALSRGNRTKQGED